MDRVDVAPEFRGIGVRIEDDILITRDRTVEILTNDCIKDITELKALVSNNFEMHTT